MISIDTLQKDLTQAYKEGQVINKATLSSLIAAVKKAAIDKGCRDNIPEELVVECIRKEIKILDEQIATCPSDRDDLIEVFKWKKDILSKYVPELVTDKGRICQMVTELLKDITIVDKGQVMKIVMPQLKGKVDMKVANQVISEWFGGK